MDFQEYIESVLNHCGVLLAVIGPHWAGESDTGRRIDDPEDWVRIEVEAALKRDLPVIPVLIDHTRMPSKADLPPSLARLARREALSVDQGRGFHDDVGQLIKGIESYLGRVPSAAPTQDRPREAAARPAEPQPPPPLTDRERSNSIGMTLVRIEPGSFLMGSNEQQIDQLLRLFPDSKREWFDVEQPQHPVTITQPFFLGIHEVTQSQYQAVIGENPSRFKGSDDLPVESVSWLDAVLFCNLLSEREKRAPFYRIYGTEVTIAGGNGYRLPTEAEWEYACRAGSTTLYPFGDEAGKLGDHAWHKGNSGNETHAVGQKQANAWGLYDMLGNVWEWCADWYNAKYYGWSPPVDPPGAPLTAYRVNRGGSWSQDPWECRTSRRWRSAARVPVD